MSLDNFTLVKQAGHSSAPTYTYSVQAGATTINRGEPVKLASISGDYVVPSADAEPVVGTPTFLGIAASTSNQTASADGTVEVYRALPGFVFRAKAKTLSTVDTAAEIAALKNNHVVLDLTSSVYTIDAAAAHAGTNGVIIIGGDPVMGTLDVIFKNSVQPESVAA